MIIENKNGALPYIIGGIGIVIAIGVGYFFLKKKKTDEETAPSLVATTAVKLTPSEEALSYRNQILAIPSSSLLHHDMIKFLKMLEIYLKYIPTAETINISNSLKEILNKLSKNNEIDKDSVGKFVEIYDRIHKNTAIIQIIKQELKK